MALLAIAAFVVFNTAVSIDPNSLPIVAALAGTGSAFEVAYAILFIREKLEPNQVVGILFLVTCVFVLVYLGV